MLKDPSAEPIAWNAALEGAKMVISLRESTVSTSPAFAKAPASEVRFRDVAVLAGEVGMVRTLEMMWIVPPVKLMF